MKFKECYRFKLKSYAEINIPIGKEKSKWICFVNSFWFVLIVYEVLNIFLFNRMLNFHVITIDSLDYDYTYFTTE